MLGWLVLVCLLLERTSPSYGGSELMLGPQPGDADCCISGSEDTQTEPKGWENGGGVTAPKFCGFGLEFSQVFWDGGLARA